MTADASLCNNEEIEGSSTDVNPEPCSQDENSFK